MGKRKRRESAFFWYSVHGERPETVTLSGFSASHRGGGIIHIERHAKEGPDAVIEHLGATLKDLGVADELIAEAAAIAESVRGPVLGRS